jgi:hypothetical protein
MPRLILIAAAVLLAPLTLSMAEAPRATTTARATPHDTGPAFDAERLSDEESRRLVAAALLVALEWGRR